MHIKKQCMHPSMGAQVSARVHRSLRGVHLSNITYDLRFLFLRAFLHIMCIRCYFTKFYYFLPFLAMSRGSHGVFTSFLVFGTFSAKALYFFCFLAHCSKQTLNNTRRVSKCEFPYRVSQVRTQ